MDKENYEFRARAALMLLQGAVRASGIPDAAIELKHDKQGVPYVLARAEGKAHRLELTTGSGYIRITRAMQSVLAVI
jgi:hypothetical protein